MPPLSSSAVRQQIAAGTLGPLYVLVGADEVEKAELAAQMVDTVDEGFRPFNVDRLYGGETTVDALLDAAHTLPMMAPRRLVVVHEAEKLLVPKRESRAADAAQERLEAFLKSPPAETTLVFVCGALDQRRRVVKLLLTQAHVVDCGTIADAADAARWIAARAQREGVTFEPAAVRVLADRGGTDVTRLRGAFDRVVLYAAGQARVSADDVKAVVSAGPESVENFGIANAIGNGDAAAALRQVGAALDAGAQPFFLMGQIRTAAERLRGPRLVPAIEALFRTDIALKSSGGDPRILLERLVVELCSGGGGQRSTGRAHRF